MYNFDRVAGIYDSTRALPDHVMTAVVDALSADLEGSGLILDAGVGTGRFAAPLRERGFDLIGLDISGAMLSEAKKRGLSNLVRGEFGSMPFAGKSFDDCLMVHVLHLVENPAALLFEVARVCRRGVHSMTDNREGISVREEYIRSMTAMGHHWADLDERRLAAIMPPTRSKAIISYSTEKKADDEIDYFNKRLSAVTWSVPDVDHARIIGRLRTRLAGKTLLVSTTISLASWGVESLNRTNLRFLDKGPRTMRPEPQ